MVALFGCEQASPRTVLKDKVSNSGKKGARRCPKIFGQKAKGLITEKSTMNNRHFHDTFFLTMLNLGGSSVMLCSLS